MMILYKLLLSSLVALQVIGPSWVLAIQTSEAFIQEASEGQALIAGIRGVVTVTPGTKDTPGYAPQYRTALALGDVISTEEESVAEILLENQGLVTIQEYSEAMLKKSPHGGLSIALEVGTAEWSIPIQDQDGNPLTFTTPNIRARTHGGLVTAEVQPTLGEMARVSRPHDSFLILASLHTQASSTEDVGLLETFCVNEGGLTIEYPGTPQGLWHLETVAPGECRGFLNGQPRAMATAMGTEYPLVDWREVCTIRTHCEIPGPAKKLIAKKQTGQALALERALLGSDKEEVVVDVQVVLATTGFNSPILPITGEPPAEDPVSPQDPAGGDQGLGDAPVTNEGGTVPPLTPFFNAGLGDGGAPPIALPTNIQTGASLWPANGMPGGQGLLSFIRGNFTADKELLVADSGLLASAPHLGKAPQNSLVVSDLSPTGAGSPSNQHLRPNFPTFQTPHHTQRFQSFNPSPTSNVQLGVEGTSRMDQNEQLAQWASAPIDPANILVGLPEGCPNSDLSCFEIVLAAGSVALEETFPTPIDSDAGVDAAIQVRSASTADPTPGGNRVVTLTKGVVLGGNTQVNLALQEKTNNSFSGLATTLGFAPQASAVSILGEPGEPAIVTVGDRILAILGGSSIQSASPTLPTALLAILDGRLHGPTVPSVIGKDAAGSDIVRADVSPIIEVVGGSAEVTTAVIVGSTASPIQTDDLDQALLEASSPILAMMNGNMTTSSDFGRVAGQNAKLDATLIPGDALVRLNASSLMVNGNLFSVTGGGQLNVNGNLLSVQGGSTVTLAGGAFVNVGAGSLFSLTNGALVDFGTGNNVVNVSNNLCAGGGCFFPAFANPVYQVAGSPSDFSVAPGFNPFPDLGTFPDGSVNTLNVGSDSAILAVEPGGTIQIQ